MIKFESFTLENGLRIVVHEDPHSLIAAVNIMYYVGARDEKPDATGLAHLCEHLMFGGSQHIPSYDGALQQVGGNNNAYTCPDLTSYYCTLPAANLETAFWLESDRMLGLSFDQQTLDIQKKVVIEEFKEIYLNQPYGDAWLNLSKLAYTKHPYQWPVIGKEINHIEQVTLQDVKTFFSTFYIPNNAFVVVAGAVASSQVKKLSKKWFGSINPGKALTKKFPQEPIQKVPRKSSLQHRVPLDTIYKAYHVPGRSAKTYPIIELLCTGVGVGKSSRLYQELIEHKAYFNTIEAYTTETMDPGLLVITGRVNEEVSIEQADQALEDVVREVQEKGFTAAELEKLKNHTEAAFFYESIDVSHRAEELALATLLGDTNLINKKLESLVNISLTDLNCITKNVLQEKNSSTLYYKRK